MTFVVLVTGASSGIGEATARRLAAQPDTHVILVARRADRLDALQRELGPERATALAADLADPETPARIAQQITAQHDALHLLVNNAGVRWAANFADGGYANVEQHMRVNFEAPLRLVEALLPLLRRTAALTGPPASERVFASGPLRAPVSIVNVTSTSGRVARVGTGGYTASKFAITGWTDSLHLEERSHGVHVGLVLPGFILTEGFPHEELRAGRLTRWMVSEPDAVVDAILEAGPGGRPERYVPRYYWLFAALRVLAPRLLRRTVGGRFTTTTYSN